MNDDLSRAELIAFLIEHRLAKKRDVKNPTRIRQFIRDDLEAETDDELQHEYDTATGARRPGSESGENYNVRQLDHAISVALVILARGFDTPTAMLLLTDDYDPATAGRALAMASDGAYKVHLGRNVQRATEQAKWNPITLNEYRLVMGDAMPHLPEPDEIEADIGW